MLTELKIQSAALPHFRLQYPEGTISAMVAEVTSRSKFLHYADLRAVYFVIFSGEQTFDAAKLPKHVIWGGLRRETLQCLSPRLNLGCVDRAGQPACDEPHRGLSSTLASIVSRNDP